MRDAFHAAERQLRTGHRRHRPFCTTAAICPSLWLGLRAIAARLTPRRV
jgi:hypothetical protein